MLIHNKDDIEFVTEFQCFLGHPVDTVKIIERRLLKSSYNLKMLRA